MELGKGGEGGTGLIRRPAKFIPFKLGQWPVPLLGMWEQGELADGGSGGTQYVENVFFSHCSPCKGLLAAPTYNVLMIMNKMVNKKNKTLMWLLLLLKSICLIKLMSLMTGMNWNEFLLLTLAKLNFEVWKSWSYKAAVEQHSNKHASPAKLFMMIIRIFWTEFKQLISHGAEQMKHVCLPCGEWRWLLWRIYFGTWN